MADYSIGKWEFKNALADWDTNDVEVVSTVNYTCDNVPYDSIIFNSAEKSISFCQGTDIYKVYNIVSGWAEQKYQEIYVSSNPDSYFKEFMLLNAVFTEDTLCIINGSSLDRSLKQVADSIREKGRLTNEMSFPREFISSIENLSTVSNSPIHISPSLSTQTVSIPDGYDGVNNVTVDAIQVDEVGNVATTNGQFTPDSGKFYTTFTVNIPYYDGSFD